MSETQIIQEGLSDGKLLGITVWDTDTLNPDSAKAISTTITGVLNGLIIPLFQVTCLPGSSRGPLLTIFHVAVQSEAAPERAHVCTQIIYVGVAKGLADWEMHRSDIHLNNAMAVRLFVFFFFNANVSLFYIAFFERDWDHLQTQIMALLLTGQILNQTREIGLPYLDLILQRIKTSAQAHADRIRSLGKHVVAMGRREKKQQKKREKKMRKKHVVPLKKIDAEITLNADMAFRRRSGSEISNGSFGERQHMETQGNFRRAVERVVRVTCRQQACGKCTEPRSHPWAGPPEHGHRF